MNFNQNKYIVFCFTTFLRIVVEIIAEDVWSGLNALEQAYHHYKISTLRSPKQFCEPDKYPHWVTDEDDLVDDNQQPKDNDSSEIPSKSVSASGRCMFVPSFDLNEAYKEDE